MKKEKAERLGIPDVELSPEVGDGLIVQAAAVAA